MKVFVLAPNESWICDQLALDWISSNSDISTDDPEKADIIWLLADWCFKHLPRSLLEKKKVITTVHHIVPEKFGVIEKNDFQARDAITTAYHVYNQRVFDFIRPLTTKRIHLIPYWANQFLWKQSLLTKNELRKKYGLPVDAYIWGSYQRDSEGSDLFSPKLEKGPDLLADYLERQYQTWQNDCEIYAGKGMKYGEPHVVLAGWRRQYIISRLESARIPYTYFERPSQDVLSELYQTLDIYPIASRCEGGPQALIECGLLGVRCIARLVGIAEQVLPSSAINDDLCLANPAVPSVFSMLLPHGFEAYRKLFKEIAS